jgi:N6-L-threonylcarbamoyladenine synthase
VQTTCDDSLGEAFDKIARLLDIEPRDQETGLDTHPGRALEQVARQGDMYRYPFTEPMLRVKGCDFSFSGLKAAVDRYANPMVDCNAPPPPPPPTTTSSTTKCY